MQNVCNISEERVASREVQVANEEGDVDIMEEKISYFESQMFIDQENIDEMLTFVLNMRKRIHQVLKPILNDGQEDA